jgi:ubiquinone biosynthesis monooxygenase Coq7
MKHAPQRQLSPLDQLIGAFDDALRHAVGDAPAPARPNPAEELPELVMDEDTRRHVAGLMRINHAGEVCAQALYAGQAATARSDAVREDMRQAAEEEIDHLAWCEQRLRELEDRPSVLNPLWYGGSFVIGAAAGLAGDGWSLGFLKETENQVESHLEDHLGQLPPEDQRSNAILAQMKVDEAHHAEMAEESGAFDLPAPVRGAMRLTAGFMKAIAYRF